MKIAIEATAACRPDRTGIPHYTIRLIESLLPMLASNGDVLQVGCRLSRWKARQHRYLPAGTDDFWIQEPVWPIMPDFDVVHGTDAKVPNWGKAARLATVHDISVLLFDGISSQRFRERKRREYQRLADTCHRIIAVSDVTRDDFAAAFDFPHDRIDVVHHGIGADFFPHGDHDHAAIRAKYQLPSQYLLFVGRVSFRKNTARLLEALAQSAAFRHIPLAWVGTMSYGHRELLPQLETLGLQDQVRFLGYVPQEDMPRLFSAASALLYPTNYEGFGIPVLEAMRSGVPVLGGNRGSVPEIAGGHAILVDPDSAEAIADGINRVLQVDAPARIAARQHAERFTWEQCARNTIAVYQRALDMR